MNWPGIESLPPLLKTVYVVPEVWYDPKETNMSTCWSSEFMFCYNVLYWCAAQVCRCIQALWFMHTTLQIKFHRQLPYAVSCIYPYLPLPPTLSRTNISPNPWLDNRIPISNHTLIHKSHKVLPSKMHYIPDYRQTCVATFYVNGIQLRNMIN